MNRFRTLLLLLWGVFIAATVMAQLVAERYEKTEYRIPMRDEVELYRAVYTPHIGEKAPVIISRIPCGSGEFSHGRLNSYLGSDLECGYIIVCQYVTERYMSRGELEHIRPAGFGGTDDISDSDDTVNWLVNHIPNNNGCVGLAGCSYPRFYALIGSLCGYLGQCLGDSAAAITITNQKT